MEPSPILKICFADFRIFPDFFRHTFEVHFVELIALLRHILKPFDKQVGVETLGGFGKPIEQIKDIIFFQCGLNKLLVFQEKAVYKLQHFRVVFAGCCHEVLVASNLLRRETLHQIKQIIGVHHEVRPEDRLPDARKWNRENTSSTIAVFAKETMLRAKTASFA